MNIKSKMKLFFKSIFTSFGSAISEEGQQILWEAEGELAEGMDVYYEVESEEGEIEYQPVPDGQYKVETKTIVIAEGKVVEIREEEKKEEEAPEPAAEETMEEEAPAAPEQPSEPTTEEIVTTEDEPFNAEEAYNELKAQMDELRGELDVIKTQLAGLLEVPADEDAFSAAKKQEVKEEKAFMFKAKNN